MKNISLDCLPLSLFVGYERENDARGVTFDYSAWAEQYGNGVLQLLVQRPGDADPYPVVLTAGENNTAVWLLSATDTAVKGQLEVQLIFTVGSVVAKTAVLPVLVGRSLAAGATPPDPYETWLETLTELAEQILHTTQPPEIRNGYWYIFDPDTGEYVNSGVKAEGEDGVGITGAQLNADYTLTLSFSDGTSYTTPSIRGAQGEPGPTPQLSIGTVTTGAAGSSAAVEISGTPAAPVLNFTIPRGDTGEVSEAELQAALLDKADVITDTASGAIASFPDGAAAPVKALTVAVEPVQDLHGYDAPWPAGGGKNLLPYPYSSQSGTYKDVIVTTQNDGTVTLNGTASGTGYFNLVSPQNPFLLKAGTYVVSGAINGCIVVVGKAADNTRLGETNSYNGVFTVSEDVDAFCFIEITSGATINGTAKPMICLSTATEPRVYAPYSNICPISGWSSVGIGVSGKNLLPTWLGVTNVNGLTSTVNADGSVRIHGTAIGAGGYISASNEFINFLKPIKKATTMTFGIGVSAPKCIRFFLAGSGGETIGVDINQGENSKTFSLSFDTVGVKAYFSTDANAEYDFTIYPQIELGSTASDYEPFVGNSCIISLGQTVYGGPLDVVNGKMAPDREPLAFDNSAWSFYSNFFYKSFASIQGNCVIGYYITENGVKMYLNANSGQVRIYLVDNPFLTSESDVGALLNGYKVLYNLATSTEFDTTPLTIELFEGANNLWSDAGDVSVEYRADTKLYIEKKITAAIAAALNS